MLTTIYKRILIQADEVKQEGKLILPNGKPLRYKIVSVGDDVKKVKAGDYVYLDKYAGQELEYNGQKYNIIEETNILAVESNNS